MLVLMSIGYSILFQRLNITASSNVVSTWNIKMIDVSYEKVSYADVVNDTPKISDNGHSLDLSTIFQAPTDEIVYTVTVKNEGTIKALLKKIDYSDKKSNEYIKVRDTISSGIAIEPDEEITFEVIVRFKDVGNLADDVVTHSLTITPVYTQLGDNDITLSEEDWLFEQNGTTITAYNINSEIIDDPTVVVIPEGVTEIAADAFRDSPIKKVTFPSTLKKIGNYSFYGCNIDALTIPENVETIGEYAFSNQVNDGNEMPIDNLTIEKYQNNYQTNAFDKIINLTVNSGEIKKSAFTSKEIVSLKLGSGVSKIDTYAFRYNFIEGELVIPENLEYIGQYSFQDNFISKLNLENASKLKTIYAFAFNNNRIQNLDIPSNVETINIHAFKSNLIKILVLNNLMYTKINNYVFANNEIEELDLSNMENMTSIGELAFYNNKIKKLILPKNLEKYLYSCI